MDIQAVFDYKKGHYILNFYSKLDLTRDFGEIFCGHYPPLKYDTGTMSDF
jgi:hypothetical protein